MKSTAKTLGVSFAALMLLSVPGHPAYAHSTGADSGEMQTLRQKIDDDRAQMEKEWGTIETLTQQMQANAAQQQQLVGSRDPMNYQRAQSLKQAYQTLAQNQASVWADYQRLTVLEPQMEAQYEDAKAHGGHVRASIGDEGDSTQASSASSDMSADHTYPPDTTGHTLGTVGQ